MDASPARRSWTATLVIAPAIVLGCAFAGSAQAAPYDISEFSLPTPNRDPRGITGGPDGNLWFTEYASGVNKVGRITPAGTVTEYSTYAGSLPFAITAGPSGKLWFTEVGNTGPEYQANSPLGTAHLSMFDPAAQTPGSPLVATRHGITPTTSGCFGANRCWGSFGGNAAVPYGLAAGPDGNIWFAAYQADFFGKMTPQGANPLSAQYTGTIPYSGGPFWITAGPDGNLWGTLPNASKVARITTAGVITLFSAPAGSQPYGIAQGPDGNLWFAEKGANAIGKITPTGTITEYPLPNANSQPGGIVAGPDGNMWFTEMNGNRIGWINPTTATPGSPGVVEYAIPTASSGVTVGIAVGPDGNIWFTESTANKIARLAVPYALTVTTAGSGSGTVTSSPAGVDCGSTCTATYDGGTSVTLTAAAASGSSFAGWSGACSGASATCVVSMSEARTVAAQFDVASQSNAAGTSGSGGAGGSGSNSGGSSTKAATLAVKGAAGSNQASSVTITSRVSVSGAGTVRQVGTRAAGQSARTIWAPKARAHATALCTASRKTPRAGTYRLTCTLGPGARAQLERQSLRVRLTTTFTPTGGKAVARSQIVVLKKIPAAAPKVTG